MRRKVICNVRDLASTDAAEPVVLRRVGNAAGRPQAAVALVKWGAASD